MYWKEIDNLLDVGGTNTRNSLRCKRIEQTEERD